VRGHTRRGFAERPRVRPSSGCDAAAQATTRARVAAVASAGARLPPPSGRTRQWRWCWTISLNSSGPFTPVLWLWLSGTIFGSQQVMGPEKSG